MRQYKIVREAFLEQFPACQVCRDQYMRGEREWVRRASDIHHRKGRAGDWLTRAEYFLPVCRLHHTELHNHPKWAMEQGYTESRLAK
jgi:hypothetical protein